MGMRICLLFFFFKEYGERNKGYEVGKIVRKG